MNPPTDRRINRTKEALRRALLEFLTEKDYEQISIQDIVDRANVGRSTFYSHYADKEDLLDENMLALAQFLREKMSNHEGHPALAFCIPTLEHIAEVRPMFLGLLGPKSARPVQEAFHRMLCELIAEFLPTTAEEGSLPKSVLVQFLAASFLAVARWWMMEAPESSIAQVNEIYVRLVSPSLPS